MTVSSSTGPWLVSPENTNFLRTEWGIIHLFIPDPIHSAWLRVDIPFKFTNSWINVLKSSNDKQGLPRLYKYNRNKHLWASLLSFSNFSSFHNFILKGFLRAEMLKIGQLHDNCKINNQYFQSTHKNEVYERGEKKN